MFIDSSHKTDISSLSNDHYDVERLIRHCDSPYIKFSEGDKNIVISSVKFFIRSTVDNLVVAQVGGENRFHRTYKVVFDSEYTVLQRGISLNDFMLLNAKDLLFRVFDNELPEIGAFTTPTPFGEIRLENSAECMFQLVANFEPNVLKLNEGYELLPFDSVKELPEFSVIAKTFRKTESKKKGAKVNGNF